MSMRWRVRQAEQSLGTPSLEAERPSQVHWRKGHYGDREDRRGLLGGGEEQRKAGVKGRRPEQGRSQQARGVTVQVGGQWANSLPAVMGGTGKAEDGGKGGGGQSQ